MTCKLSVNVNAIAMLRNRRDLPWPSVVGMSRIALEAGSYGITVHPRPDERHIRTHDVYDLSAMIREEFPDREYNVEGYPDERLLKLAEEVRPDQVTLVPDSEEQSTSDHGWEIEENRSFLTDTVARLHEGGFRVALFADAIPEVAEAAKSVGADRIEIYTGPYGGAFEPSDRERAFEQVVATGKAAGAVGLGLNAGHDLTLENLPPVVSALPNLAEVSIGHSLTSDALIHGMAGAVALYRSACGDSVGG